MASIGACCVLGETELLKEKRTNEIGNGQSLESKRNSEQMERKTEKICQLTRKISKTRRRGGRAQKQIRGCDSREIRSRSLERDADLRFG
jgi:hypothetical protein